jgi:hypothetical protein
VKATEVSMQDDGSVRATITYVYKDGKVVAERTSFDLVRDDEPTEDQTVRTR